MLPADVQQGLGARIRIRIWADTKTIYQVIKSVSGREKQQGQTQAGTHTHTHTPYCFKLSFCFSEIQRSCIRDTKRSFDAQIWLFSSSTIALIFMQRIIFSSQDILAIPSLCPFLPPGNSPLLDLPGTEGTELPKPLGCLYLSEGEVYLTALPPC